LRCAWLIPISSKLSRSRTTPPARQQVEEDRRVAPLAGVPVPVLVQDVAEARPVRVIAQVDQQRHRRFAARPAERLLRQLVREAAGKRGLAGAVVTEQHPQAAAFAYGPGEAMRQQVDRLLAALDTYPLPDVMLRQRAVGKVGEQPVEVWREIDQRAFEILGGEAADAAGLGGFDCLWTEAATDDHAACLQRDSLWPAQPALEGIDDCRADGLPVILAFDEVVRFVEALFQGGDEVDTVAVERLFGLDAVTEQAQQVGDAFLETLALRRAQPRVAWRVEVAALLDGQRLGGVLLLDPAFHGQEFPAQLAVLADDRRVGFGQREDRLAATQVAPLGDFDQAAGREIEILFPHLPQAGLEIRDLRRNRRGNETDLQRAQQTTAARRGSAACFFSPCQTPFSPPVFCAP
jgi:hypothetical protein